MESCLGLRKPPMSGMWMYLMPWVLSVFGRVSLLNWGLCLLRGTVRTSTSKVTPKVLSNSMNSSRVLVECPIVRIVNPDFLAKQMSFSSNNYTAIKYKNRTCETFLHFLNKVFWVEESLC